MFVGGVWTAQLGRARSSTTTQASTQVSDVDAGSDQNVQPPAIDSSLSPDQAEAIRVAAVAREGPVAAAIAMLKAQISPRAADRLATQNFRPYVDPLNDAAGGVLIHAYRFHQCELRIVVNPEVWDAMPDTARQAWESKLADPHEALSPQCSRTGSTWTTLIVDLKGTELASF